MGVDMLSPKSDSTRPDPASSDGPHQTVIDGVDFRSAQPDHVWGYFPVEDEETAKLVRSVLVVSVLAGALVFISAMLNFFGGGWYWGALYLVIGLILCTSGFAGAKHKDRQLLICFAACNCIFVVLLAVSAVLLIVSTITLATTGGIDGCKGNAYAVIGGTVYDCTKVIGYSSAQIVLIALESVFYGCCSFLAFKLTQKITPRPAVAHFISAQPQTYPTHPQPPPQFAYSPPTNTANVVYGQPSTQPLDAAPPLPV
eukprot:CAMPEP_0113847284 /NCGR_PEP_ID=MMETSP0372-20130328/1785_1 /TAXON_ID=340204 /ORGANISM="Lankesteria abbotti" /LENGTH=255 /DNA_ID=CAMNT_0000816537 /DNA_START=41 /DNA_END=808 /DNA_ORIENTATION=+ /assembly_acc=CAM_ASM_000359